MTDVGAPLGARHLRLQEIRRRLSAATPGPWERAEEAITHGSTQIASVLTEYDFPCLDAEELSQVRAECEANSQLIQHAPEDIKFLLDVVAGVASEAGRPEPESDYPWEVLRNEVTGLWLYDRANDLMLATGHLTNDEVFAVRDALNRVEVAREVLTKEESDVIRREIRDGTPNTPQRIETMRRADEVFARSGLGASPAEPLTVARLAALLREWSSDDDERSTGEAQLYTDDEWASALAAWLLPRLGAVPVAPE